MLSKTFKLMILCFAMAATTISNAFHLPTATSLSRRTTTRDAKFSTILRSSSSSSKEEEIARLEEQLKKLKEESAKAEADSIATSPMKENASVPIEQEDVVPMEMFLSEGWKEKESAESVSGGGQVLSSILGVVALVIGLALFSQVPIGQEDLSKYSAIKAPTEQIDLGDLNRARNSNNGDL